VSTSKRRNRLDRQGTEPPVRSARAAALDALARRDYATEELRRKLLEKGYDAAVVAPLLEALRAEKLLDDRRYTENFVTYHAVRGQGPLRIRAISGLDCAAGEGAGKEIWRRVADPLR
jgi:SOS response regulatory protein OraA/RecX